MKEVGPRFDLIMRRNKIASADLFKTACKKPKLINVDLKKAHKNVYTTDIGDRKGKVFIQQQDIETMALRKFKKQRPATLGSEDV